jgi:hypothetical protein
MYFVQILNAYAILQQVKSYLQIYISSSLNPINLGNRRPLLSVFFGWTTLYTLPACTSFWWWAKNLPLKVLNSKKHKLFWSAHLPPRVRFPARHVSLRTSKLGQRWSLFIVVTPTWFKHPDMQVPYIQGSSEKNQLHAYPGDPTFELHLFAECVSAIHKQPWRGSE